MNLIGVERLRWFRNKSPGSKGILLGMFLVILVGGAVFLFGVNREFQEIIPVQIAAGAYHSCSLLSDHSVKCWGRNGNGQLGRGVLSDTGGPWLVPGIKNAVSVAAGAFHTCMLDLSGRIECWGANDSGQLGIGGPKGHAPARGYVELGRRFKDNFLF